MQKSERDLANAAKRRPSGTARNLDEPNSPKRRKKHFVFVSKSVKSKKRSDQKFVFRKPLASVENKVRFYKKKIIAEKQKEFSKAAEKDFKCKKGQKDFKGDLKAINKENKSPQNSISEGGSDKENNSTKTQKECTKAEEHARALREISAEGKAPKSEKLNLNYGEIVEKGKRFFSQNYDFHAENRPSSQSSIDDQLALLRGKVYPFSYTAPPAPASRIRAKAPAAFGVSILRHLKATESQHQPPRDCVERQLDVTERMRSVLLDWLADVRASFRLGDESFFLAANLVDRFLARRQVGRAKFQLLGCAALFLASKFCEVSPPVAKDFVYVADSSFSHAELYRMEVSILKLVGWRVANPPHGTFCDRLLRLAGAGAEQRHLASFLLELSLFSSAMGGFAPSLLAASAVFIALHRGEKAPQKPVEEDTVWQTFLKDGGALEAKGRPLKGAVSAKVAEIWKKEVAPYCSYDASDLKECVLRLKGLVVHPNENEHSIRRKYSDGKFSEAAVEAREVVKKVVLGSSV